MKIPSVLGAKWNVYRKIDDAREIRRQCRVELSTFYETTWNVFIIYI